MYFSILLMYMIIPDHTFSTSKFLIALTLGHLRFSSGLLRLDTDNATKTVKQRNTILSFMFSLEVKELVYLSWYFPVNVYGLSECVGRNESKYRYSHC